MVLNRELHLGARAQFCDSRIFRLIPPLKGLNPRCVIFSWCEVMNYSWGYQRIFRVEIFSLPFACYEHGFSLALNT